LSALIVLALALLSSLFSTTSGGGPLLGGPRFAGELYPPVFVGEWGSSGEGAGQFNEPCGIAVDSGGYVYVADSLNHRVQKFDNNGAFMRMWGWGVDNNGSEFQVCTSSCYAGLGGSNNGQFFRPRGVGVNDSEDVFVADTQNDRIQKFDNAGNYLTQWGSQGGGSPGFYWPYGVAFDASGNVLVADLFNERIKKHSSIGTFLYMWGWGVNDGTSELQVCSTLTLPCQAGVSGTGDGQMDNPSGLEVDAAGNVYIADLENDRVQKFTGAGAYLTQWGTFGDNEGQLRFPVDIAIDSRGVVYVVEHAGDRVSMFDRDGNFLARWGASGTGEGEFDSPVSVAVDSAGYVYVADRDNHRIQKFAGPWLEVFVGDQELPRAP
jgi:DNA-binding beta-propeller fold protein YncE